MPLTRVEKEGLFFCAETEFRPEHSDIHLDSFIFAYYIDIENKGGDEVTITGREWVFIDDEGKTEKTTGPLFDREISIAPGEKFSYMNFCHSKTGFATLEGFFDFRHNDGRQTRLETGRLFLADNSGPISRSSTFL